ncbi:MAG: hypothetical protein JO155_02825 [Acidimicrobiia bacterium]|nr:hypothetical protein [Acidimicrobiia bacterium]
MVVGDPLRIVVLGMMGRCPFGGQTWLYLNWLRGLADLGHEVWYVEDDSVWPYDPRADAVTDDCSYAVEHISSSLIAVGLADRWAYRLADRDGACWGLGHVELLELYRTADVLLNIGGAVDLRDEHMTAALRVYVETDPVTAELRLACGDDHTKQAFAAHDVLATYGENYGAPNCGVPVDGLAFITTRQPIALELWPEVFAPDGPVTTIGNYRQDGGDVEYRGETYHWSKHHEWEKFLDLPIRTANRFLLAMMPDDPADRAHLESHGWQLVSPIPLSLDVFGSYPDFVRASRAEFTVAKDQNVRLRSGWFSERDACYLASGKPVVTQDTGFGAVLPTGEGLFAVETVEEAADALACIDADYVHQCKAARDIAEDFFEASGVARRLLADVGAS